VPVRCPAPVEKHPGHRESHSGLKRKPFAFPSESLFTFSPESRSPSPRNRFHVHPGILFTFARNPQEADRTYREHKSEPGGVSAVLATTLNNLGNLYSDTRGG
jgi:hypothetical protein